MFTEIFQQIASGDSPDRDRLERRFDMALVKKFGVLRLPASFWTADPKINPPAEQLLWIALLLGDRSRIEQAFSAFVLEYQEKTETAGIGGESRLDGAVARSLEKLRRLVKKERCDAERWRRMLDGLYA